MTRTQAVLATLVVYKIVLIALGLWARRRTHDGVDFFLGGRALGPMVAAISASASSSSAWTLLRVSGAAYAWGVSAIWLFPACVGGFARNWYVLAPGLRALSRRTGAVTVTEVMAGDPGHPLAATITRLASFILLFSLLAYVAAQFHAAGKTFTETFGLGTVQSVLLGGGVVVLYTMLGGFWAVSLTDTLQGLVMAATAILLPLAALVAVGGPAGLADGLGELGYPGQPPVVNRFMALQEGEAPLRRAQRIALAWAVVVYAGMILLGLCGRVLLPALADREVIFLAATNRLFPPVMAGVMIAAVLSAIMSTADSQLLVAGSAVAHDLKLGGATPRTMLFRSRVVVLLLSLAAIAAALVGSQQIFSRVLFAWAAMGAAFGPLLLVIVLRGAPPPGRALAAMAFGFFLSVGAYWWAPGDAAGFWERVVPFVVALAILLVPASRGRRTAPVAS